MLYRLWYLSNWHTDIETCNLFNLGLNHAQKLNKNFLPNVMEKKEEKKCSPNLGNNWGEGRPRWKVITLSTPPLMID